VLLGIPIGIDDDRFLGAPARNEVARLGELRVVNSAEQHDEFRAGVA
jgi:hypothetical protein